jgi:malonate transporter
MSQLGDSFSIVVPLLVMAAVGVVAGKWFGFAKGSDSIFAKYVVFVSGPAALILELSKTDWRELANGRMIGAAAITYSLTYLLPLLVHRYALKRSLGESAFAAFTLAQFNLIIIGLPITLAVFGSKGIPAFAILAIIGFLTVVPLTTFLHGISEPTSGHSIATCLWRGARETITNPLVIGMAIGVVIALTGWTIPAMLHAPLTTLGASVVPIGMLAIGLSVSTGEKEAWTREIWLMSAAKMVLVPALAIGVAWCFRLDAIDAAMLVLLFAIPSAVVTYALAKQFNTYAKQTGAIVVLSTIMAAIGLPAWIWVTKCLYGI